MVKKFRSYEWKGETIVVEEVGKVKFFWYKFLDFVEPFMNWLDPILIKFGYVLTTICIFLLVIANFFKIPYIDIPIGMFIGIFFTYTTATKLLEIKKAYRAKP